MVVTYTLYIKDYLASLITLNWRSYGQRNCQDRNKEKTNNGDPHEFGLGITLKCYKWSTERSPQMKFPGLFTTLTSSESLTNGQNTLQKVGLNRKVAKMDTEKCYPKHLR